MTRKKSTIKKKVHDQKEYEKFVAGRKEIGRKIDPATAECMVWWGQVIDPYGILDPFPKDCDCVGRINFARAPGSDIWVAFEHLPAATVRALYGRDERI